MSNYYKPFLTFLLCTIAINTAHAETISSLDQQGMSEGLSILDNSGPESFYLRVPADTALVNPRVKLHLNIAPGLMRESTLQVFINGQPRTQLSIGNLTDTNSDRDIVIPLSGHDLEGRYIAVRVAPTFINTTSPCMNDEANRGYIHILPDSGFVFDDADRTTRSIRSFLSLLNQTVRVKLPTDIKTAQEFQTVLAVSAYLQSQGRHVEWSKGSVVDDTPADIVIDNRRGISSASTSADLTTLKNSDLLLVPSSGDKPAQLIVSTNGPQALLLAPWSDLLTSTAYSNSSTPARNGAVPPRTISLSQFGVTAEAVPLAAHASWTLSLPPEVIRQKAPDSLHLNMVVPPSLPGNPLLLHVFDNGNLRNITALPEHGGPISVDLPLVETRNMTNDNLRLDLVRQNNTGNCQGTLARSYAQILPSSTITTTNVTTADTLDTIGRTFDSHTPVYLPPDALRSPTEWMTTLASVINELHLNPYDLTIHADNSTPSPGHTFLWLRPEAPTGFMAPIHFDRGRLRIVESDGTVLLDAPPLPDIELAAVLRHGKDRGLWIKPTGNSPPVRPLGFDTASGDVVFMDKHGQIITLNTQVTAAALNAQPAVTYPDNQSWLDRVQNMRLWILGGGLFALTIIVLSIIDKIKPRRSDKNDV